MKLPVFFGIQCLQTWEQFFIKKSINGMVSLCVPCVAQIAQIRILFIFCGFLNKQSEMNMTINYFY